MKITMLGSGYVGLVSGACFADFGNDVTCVDIDPKKVEILEKGEIPFYEPGLKDLVERNTKEKRLKFSTNVKKGVEDAEVIFICVGTPEGERGTADLKYVLKAAEDIGKYIDSYKVIVMKSTVPVGTNKKITRAIKSSLKKKVDFDVVSNPEFLREGAAVKDFQNPDRTILGLKTGRAREIMEKLYRHVARVNKPIMVTIPETAEMIKYASNAMLAARISFMNELSHLCEDVGADIKEVAKGMGLDRRIGPSFLQAGAGYGGSCFPKDVKALAQMLEDRGHTSALVNAIDYINERQKKSLVPKLKKFLPKLEGKRIAIWGLAFKPRTSDTREAPAYVVIKQLQDEYADVVAYDPEGMPEAKKKLKKVEFVDNAYDALYGADALIVCTEWDQFREVDFHRMQELMRNHIIIDGRNIYSPKGMEKVGFKYACVGR